MWTNQGNRKVFVLSRNVLREFGEFVWSWLAIRIGALVVVVYQGSFLVQTHRVRARSPLLLS